MSKTTVKTPQVFLVGGAVRDRLLGLPAQDRDWVVVGSTPESLLSQGYVAVGADFPVFLHPKTREEYALARTERKTAPGHRGFSVCFSDDVTLEDDLGRRDLTVNAIAESLSGELFDPYDGQGDLARKTLRHVGIAFRDDPLRILRVARFSARYPDFSVHPDTLALMSEMVQHGELSHLTSERVMGEIQKVFETAHPWKFFQTLQDVSGLAALFGQPLNVKAMRLSLERPQTTALPSVWRQALGFSKSGLTVFQTSSLTHRYRFPKELEFAIQAMLRFGHEASALSRDPEVAWEVCKKLDGVRRPERFFEFLDTLESQSSFSFAALRSGARHVHALHIGEQLALVLPQEKANAAETLRKACFLDAWRLQRPHVATP